MHLIDVIGIQYPRERREAVQAKGIAGIKYFAEFYGEDIKTLCPSVWNLGGTIPNPAAVNAELVENMTDLIPRPGFSTPAICEKRMTPYAYTDRIYKMV